MVRNLQNRNSHFDVHLQTLEDLIPFLNKKISKPGKNLFTKKKPADTKVHVIGVIRFKISDPKFVKFDL